MSLVIHNHSNSGIEPKIQAFIFLLVMLFNLYHILAYCISETIDLIRKPLNIDDD